MIVGYALIAVWFTAYINVPLLPREAWGAGLIISNLLMWASISLPSVNGVPYLMSVAPAHERGKAFAFQAAILPVTAFLGSLVAGFLPGFLIRVTGGALPEVGAYRAALGLPVFAYLVSAGLLSKARPAPPLVLSSEPAERQAAPIGLLAFLGLFFGVQLASEGTLMTYLNVYFSKDLLVSTSLIGGIFAIVRLMPFFISPLLPLAFTRWGSGLTLTASYGLVFLSALAFAFFHHWIAASVAFLLASLASSIAQPARSLFGQESVLPRWRTTVNAVSTISMAGGNALAGYAGGWLIKITGYPGLFLFSGALAIGVIVLYAGKWWRKLMTPAALLNQEEASQSTSPLIDHSPD